LQGIRMLIQIVGEQAQIGGRFNMLGYHATINIGGVLLLIERDPSAKIFTAHPSSFNIMKGL
jgi:hypothetical protein